MEYSLLKTIESPLGYFDPLQAMLQSPYQSIDFVNPGLGGLAKLYDVYVPIPYLNPPHCSNKTTDQQGFGATSSQEVDQSKVETEIINEAPKLSNDKEDSQDLVADPEVEEDKSFETKLAKIHDRKRKLLGTEVFEAFLHPLVKTTKLSVKSTKEENNLGNQKEQPKAKKSLPTAKISTKVPPTKHKFKII